MASLKTKVVGGSAAAGFAIFLSMAMFFEGKVNVGYYDPINIPTACWGHTGPEVVVGQPYSDEDCRRFLSADGRIAWDAVTELTPGVQLEPWQHAAFADFVMNAGIGNFKSSTMLRLINSGRVDEACEQLPLWIYAGKGPNRRVLKGLVNRRAAEYDVCMGKPTTFNAGDGEHE